MKRISGILFLICVFVSLSANAQLYSWENLRANQEIGYAGRGNQNELLVSVCYNQQKTMKLTVNYNVFGSYSDDSEFTLSDYVGKVKLYARKRNKEIQYQGLSAAYPDKEISFTKTFDVLDKTNKKEITLLAETDDLKQTQLVSKTKLKPGDYLIYLAVDIKNFDLDKLPLFIKKLTRIGGKITRIGMDDISIENYVHAGQYSKKTTDWQHFTYDPIAANYPKGSKVVVPGYQILYTPGDANAKYYSMPAIATAADGSILALTDARKLHIHELYNDIDILARRSMDNGKTWSEPFPIFEGKMDNSLPVNCKNSHGYSNPAIVAFNDGTIMVCAQAENGMSTYRTPEEGDPYTYVVYRISRDNGKTWGEIQEVNPVLFGGTNNDPGKNMDKYKYRGRIAAGQFFVAQKGLLRGKAVCCLRTTYETEKGTSHKAIYVLYYDHITNEWNSIKSTENFKYEGSKLVGLPEETHVKDEFFKDRQEGRDAQIIEIGENRFLISMSDKSEKSRTYWFLKVAKAEVDGRSVIYEESCDYDGSNTLRLLSQVPCNGGLLKYRGIIDGKEQEVLLQTTPKGMFKRTTDQEQYAEDYYSKTSLSMYMAPVPADNSIQTNWKFMRCLSDWMDDNSTREDAIVYGGGLLGGLAECAQASSVTLQRDKTVGIMFEGSPIIIRQASKNLDNKQCSVPGGWVMGQYYLNLRIGDLTSGIEPEEPKECAFQTRVNTNFNGGKKFNYNTDAEYQENDCPTFYSYWSSNNATGIDNVSILKTFETNTDNCTEWLNNGEREGQDFVLTAVGANEFSAYDSNQPGVSAGTLKYTDKINDSEGAQKRQFRLDAYPTILPDAFTATDFNAVVVCKVGDKYLTDNTGKIKYYVINGKKRPYGIKSNMSVQSAGVYEWWELNKNNNVTPKCVGLTQDTHSGMLEDVFYRPLDENGNIPWLMENGKYVLDANGNKQPDLSKTQEYRVKVEGALNFLDIQKSFPAGTHPKVVVEFYITGNNNASVDKMLSAKNYLLKVNHPIVYDETFTDVEEIENGMSESENRLIVAAAEGGATVTGEQMNVSVYNVMGMLVKNFYLDGEQYVELPQGIYIANGQKFIVR